MQLEAATPDAVLKVAHRMRDDDFREFIALSTADTREALAEQLAARFGQHPAVTVAWLDGEPVAVGGLLETRPGVLTVLFFATDSFPRIALSMTRFIKRRLFPAVIGAGAHRIECVVLTDYWAARKWVFALGLTPEGPPMRGYGKNGEIYQQYSWVADACPVG